MKRTISVKLIHTKEQAQSFKDLADTFASACNDVVPFAQEHRCWNRVALHHFAYNVVRTKWPSLGSQMACNAIHKVASAYKTLKANKGISKDKAVPLVVFKPKSVHFDKRTYSIKGNTLSLFTMAGREKVQFASGPHQLNLLSQGAATEAELICKKGQWYFNLVLDIPDVAPSYGNCVTGVDVGENNIAATSSGRVFDGGKLRHDRDKYLAHRRRLQSNGSQSAKQRLRKISGKERRHVAHVNHVISKAVVAEAVSCRSSEIRLEDLTHIRDRIKAGKRVRARLHRWAWRQLQDFVAYKAQGVGITVNYVNPAYTSQTCSVCQELGKRHKHRFVCTHCGHVAHSDINGARNIAAFAEVLTPARGAVNRPNVHSGSPV
ncbi:MAG: RNA-guided endonuclease InsQ/TnpB family protein [Acidithiobacillus sp.]